MTEQSEGLRFRGRRYFRYRVVDVGGSMVGRVDVGDLTYDYWHGRGHTYSIYNLGSGEETGWYRVKSEGECTPDQYAAMYAAMTARETATT